MAKIKKLLRWIGNVEQAIEMWNTVPISNVAYHLNSYRKGSLEEVREPPTCGTVCCFGGWVPHWPAFAELGVRAAPVTGMPLMLHKGTHLAGTGVAAHLFGDANLFDMRRLGELGTDWDVVMIRLQRRREELCSQTFDKHAHR